MAFYEANIHEMINQLEIPMYLEDNVPGITEQLTIANCNVYEIMHTLTDVTCENIKKHDFKMVKKCFNVADKLYCKGNAAVKNAVQNVFVYSFTPMFQKYPEEKKQLLALIPVTLYSLYVAQLYRCGC